MPDEQLHLAPVPHPRRVSQVQQRHCEPDAHRQLKRRSRRHQRRCRRPQRADFKWLRFFEHGILPTQRPFYCNVNGCPLYSGFDGESLCTKEVQEKTYAVYSNQKYTTSSFGTGNPNKTNTMRDIDTLIWSMSVIYPDIEVVNASSSLWPDVRLQATECALYYCVKDVSSSMEGNQLLENITEATDAVGDPESWQRGSSKSSLGPEYVPPPDEVNSLEFNPRYSTAFYS